MKKNILAITSLVEETLKKYPDDFLVVGIDSSGEIDTLSEEVRGKIDGVAAMGSVSRAFIDKLPNLKVISNFGVGYDGIDAEYAASKGIMVAHTPDVLSDEVANTTLALLLATTRRIVAYDKYVRAGNWVKKGEPPYTHGLANKTVGIVGLGRIGETFAKKVSVFDCRISYHTRNERDVSYQYYPRLEELARDSDVLVVITPGGKETKGLINKKIIEALGPEGTLVNIARGSVVDEQEMVKALKDGRLGAAGLDVFEDEPNVPKALFEMDNVVLTPHIGSATVETRDAMMKRLINNLQTFFEDGKPINPVPECRELG